MAQLYRSQSLTNADFDGLTVTTGLFDFSNLDNSSSSIAIEVDGLFFLTDASNILWFESWWVHPSDGSMLYLGAADVTSMVLPSGLGWAARACPGIVPRLPDKRLFRLAFVTSGNTNGTGIASISYRSSMGAGVQLS